MARGKEATAAARRRYEAAMEVVDRLTTENADLKVRTKQCELDASRARALDDEVRALRQALSDNTTPELERLRAKVREVQDAADRRCERLFVLLQSGHEDDFSLPLDEWQEVQDLVGARTALLLDLDTRLKRRNVEYRGAGRYARRVDEWRASGRP